MRNLTNTGGDIFVNTLFQNGEAIEIVQPSLNSQAKVNVSMKENTTEETSVNDTDLFLVSDTTGKVVKYITGANLKGQIGDTFWTRSSGNIFPANSTDTILSNNKIQIDTLADSTYLDSFIFQNTNSGTDVLKYKFMIKDDGSYDASLKLRVEYDKNGANNDVLEVIHDGQVIMKKRLLLDNGLQVGTENFNFLSTGGTLATTGFFSGTSPITYNSSTGAIGTSFTLASITATSPIAYNNSTGVISTTFTPTSTDNMSGKTFTDQTVFNRSLQVKNGGGGETNVSGSVRFFEASDNGSFYTDLHTGGSSHQLTDNRNVYLPDATGTVVLVETNIWETQGTNIITPSNTSLTAIDLPNNCSIRNDAQDTQFIKFSHTTSTNETIELASNQVSIENLLVASVNSAYYLKFGNGILDSTFTQIHIPQDSYIINDGDTTNDWIQFKEDIFNINFANIDCVEGVKIRNTSDKTNDYISLRNDHFYINFATTEVIQGGKIANGSAPSTDYIQFNAGELFINYPVVDVAQSTIFQNSSNNNSAFAFESDRIKYIGPVLIDSPYSASQTRFPLEITGYITADDTTGTALYYQNVPSLGGRAIAINGDVNMSAKFEYGLYVETGQELWVASDERIKKDITIFTGGLDLLRKIEVKNYKYIDGKGKEPQHNEIGFIAQEVKEIYPHAISFNKEYIPNEYKEITCEWSDYEGKFKMKSNDLNNVDNVDYKFFCWNEGDKIETKITSIGNSDNTFLFDKKWEHVFCIGNKINDFNILDKQSLFTINFSATKELDVLFKKQEEEINILKEEVNSLKEILNKLTNSKSFAEFKKLI